MCSNRRQAINWLIGISVVLTSSVLCSQAYSEVAIDWVEVGDPGNAADDTDIAGRFDRGAVADVFRIGKFEITNAQYADFLNAVAETDDNELYKTQNSGDIVRNGAPGSYSYEVAPARAQKPVVNVSFWDAARFANWLHNGQPTGTQDPDTTEDGAYTLDIDAMAANAVTRNEGSTFFLPSEDEWIKAAHYKAGGLAAGYWNYPTAADDPPIAEAPSGGSNSANFEHVVGGLTDVGAYTLSASPYGTFDQAGNALEWTETITGNDFRIAKGGNYISNAGNLLINDNTDGGLPTLYHPGLGFRIAAVVPEPSGLVLAALGLLSLITTARFRNHEKS